jgi:hypothetical protein
VKRIVFALVLFAVLVNAAPALADDPRLMREDAPSFAPAPYYEEPHTNHKPAKIAAPPPPRGAYLPPPPVRAKHELIPILRPCPQVCIQ